MSAPGLEFTLDGKHVDMPITKWFAENGVPKKCSVSDWVRRLPGFVLESFMEYSADVFERVGDHGGAYGADCLAVVLLILASQSDTGDGSFMVDEERLPNLVMHMSAAVFYESMRRNGIVGEIQIPWSIEDEFFMRLGWDLGRAFTHAYLAAGEQ